MQATTLSGTPSAAAYNRILDGADVDRTLAALQAQAEKIYRDAAP